MANVFDRAGGPSASKLEEKITLSGPHHSFLYDEDTGEYLSPAKMQRAGWVVASVELEDDGMYIVWSRPLPS